MAHLTASTNRQRIHNDCGGIIDPPWPRVVVAMGDPLECRSCKQDDIDFLNTRLEPICAEFAEYGTCIHSDHPL